MSAIPAEFDTDRLVGRPPDATDEGFCAEMWADPRVADWLGGTRDLDRVRSTLRHFDDLWANGHGVWILGDRETRDRVGWVLLHPMDFGGETGTEVGWAIRPDRWREGLASEAAARVVAIGFLDAGHDELMSGTMVTNVASRGVMEKVGFRRHREVEHAGLAHVVYRLSRERWEAGRG